MMEETYVKISFSVCSLLAVITKWFSSGAQKEVIASSDFTRLQRQFLSVYLVALFSDWLKGAYVYSLYSSYGYKESQIAVLYVAGFASSAVFGTLAGPLTDSLGRRSDLQTSLPDSFSGE